MAENETKTILNCSSREFLKQMNAVKHDAEKFIRATKINEIQRSGVDIPDDASDEEKAKLRKKAIIEKWETIFNVCFSENCDLTYSLIAKLCFTDVETIEQWTPTQVSEMLILLLADSRINDFFTALSVWGLLNLEER